MTTDACRSREHRRARTPTPQPSFHMPDEQWRTHDGIIVFCLAFGGVIGFLAGVLFCTSYVN